METKFTSGEWDWSPCNNTEGTSLNGMHYLIWTRHTKIAKVIQTSDVPMSKEQEANAKLIAAAPDMFKALNNIVEYWNSPQDSKKSMNDHIKYILEIAEQAMQKATE